MVNEEQVNQDVKLAEDLSRFYNDLYGFVMYVFPWGEPGPLERHTGPDKWQLEQMADIKAHLEEDPLGLYQDATASGHGIGKILSNINDLDTPSGFKSWGDINIDDYVFGSNGRPTKVIAKYPHKNWKFYKIVFSDGTSTYAGLEHQWSVTTKNDRDKKRGYKTVTTETMAGNLKRKYQIPLTAPVNYRKRKVEINPYVLGYILGNGSLRTKSAVKIACIDPEIYKYIDNNLPDGLSLNGKEKEYQHVSSGRNTGDTNQLVKSLDKLKLNGKTGLDKFIPDNYKYNTADIRTEVLKGLMDSDGTISTRKGDHGRIGYKVQYSTSSEQLRDDVIWIVKSLGGVANYSIDNRKNNNNYEVHINLPNKINPFMVKRKKDLYDDYVATVKREPIKTVISIEFDHIGEGHCITVDAKDHLYLANDFIVTHNSAEVAWIILWMMSTRRHLNGVITANTFPQLKTKTWRELAVWHKRAVNTHWFKWTETKFSQIDHPETWFVSPIANNEHNSEAFAGQHAEHSLIIYDEASAIPDAIWQVSRGVKDPRTMWFVFGNPTQNTGEFRKCFGRNKGRWKTRQVDSRDCKMPNKEELDKDVEEYGVDSDFVRVRIRGVFPRMGDEQFISTEVAENAARRNLEVPRAAPKILGVDVARFGSDQTVFARRHGRKLEPLRKFRGLDTMQVAALVVDEIRRNKVDVVMIDGVGLGAGVVDRVRQLGHDCIEVLSGKPPDKENEDVCFNKRSEMWFRMRDWLDTADIPDDAELVDDLTQIKCLYDNKHRIQMESKKDMKRRGLSSPDCGDALGLTFSYNTPPVRTRGRASLDPEYAGDV